VARQVERYPDLLPARPDLRGLSPRDAALASALYDATLRRWVTLEHCVAAWLRQPVKALHPAVHAAIFVGAAQLLLFDRVPDHAAIYETVEWAKRHAPRRTVALVNAILRRVLGMRGPEATPGRWESPHACLSRTDAIPLSDGRFVPVSGLEGLDDTERRVAVLTSHRQGLIARWLEQFGEERTAAIAAHGLVLAPIVLNARHAEDELIQHLREHELAAAHEEDGRLVWTGPITELSPTLARHPEIWVQDSSAARAVEAAAGAGLQPGLILDACAGRGTKTRQLLGGFPEARVVAADTDSERLEDLARDLAGDDRLTVTPTARLPDAVAPASVDLLVVDVPCSNTGVLARRLEARYRFSRKQLRRLVAIQRDIIKSHAPLLAPSGRILYTTCSLEIEENHALVREAADALSMRVLGEDFTLPTGLPGSSPGAYRDGAYWALLGRS